MKNLIKDGQNGLVMSVFAGLGKTTVGKKYENIYDLQSSSYRCDYTNISPEEYEKLKESDDRIPNPDWPENFVQALKEKRKNYDLVLVASSLDIRELLEKNNIDYTFVLPDKSDISRENLILRYKEIIMKN